MRAMSNGPDIIGAQASYILLEKQTAENEHRRD